MHAVVQPIFETLIVFAWCVLTAGVPTFESAGVTREEPLSQTECHVTTEVGKERLGRDGSRSIHPFLGMSR
jgi:hypothetical protein